MYCKFCGTELDDEAKFCTKCGKRTDEDFSVEAEEVSYAAEKTINDPKKVLKILAPIIIVLLLLIAVLIVKNNTTKNNRKENQSDQNTTAESGAEDDNDLALEDKKNNDDNIVAEAKEPETNEISSSELENTEVVKETEEDEKNISSDNALQLTMFLSYSKAGLTPYEIGVTFDNNGREVKVPNVLELEETLVDDESVLDDSNYVISETFAKFYRDYLQSEQEKIDVRYLDACEYYAQIGENGYAVEMDCFPAEFKLECDGKEIVFHTIDSVISASNGRSVRESSDELGKAVYTASDSQDGGAIVCEMKIVANIESDNMEEFNSFISGVVGGTKVNEDDGTNTFNGTWSQKGDDSYVFTLEDGTGHLHSDFSDDCDITYTYNGKVLYMETNFGTVEYYYYPDKDLLCRDYDGAEFYRN